MKCPKCATHKTNPPDVEIISVGKDKEGKSIRVELVCEDKNCLFNPILHLSIEDITKYGYED